MKTFAFVFPGQGSQSVGMLDAWGDNIAVKEALAEASEALKQDLGQLIAQGSKEDLALTTNTQPVMLVAGVAAYRAWCAAGGTTPSILAGHSLGEYSALVASDALTLTQAAPLVRLRAQAMQQAVPVGTGAMAAVLGLDATAVRTVCQQVCAQLANNPTEVVEAVNFNDPMQTVIAGSKAAVAQASEALKQAGAKRVLPLPVSAPFHSSLMRPAAEALAEALSQIEIQTPKIPVLNNIDVAIADSPDAIRDALYRQAFGPVRWVESIQAIAARKVDAIIECGPGKALLGMIKRIQPEMPSAALYDPNSLNEVKAMLQ